MPRWLMTGTSARGAAMSTTDDSSIFAVPAVPIGPKAEGQSDEYTGRITRQLCAAAYVRPDRLASVRSWWVSLRAQMVSWVRKRLHFKPTATPKASSAESEPRHRRWCSGPTTQCGYGSGSRHSPAGYHPRFRSGTSPAGLRYGQPAGAQAHRCTGCCGARRSRGGNLGLVDRRDGHDHRGRRLLGTYLADRYTAQQRLNALLTGGLPTAPTDPASHALPYVREMPKGTPRDRFLGAGLQAWPPAVIGIDVEPAPPGQDDELPGPLIPGQKTGSSREDIATAILTALTQQGRGNSERKPMKQFKGAELHAYVAKRLLNPAPSHDRSHPVPHIDVVGVAAISGTAGPPWTTRLGAGCDPSRSTTTSAPSRAPILLAGTSGPGSQRGTVNSSRPSWSISHTKAASYASLCGRTSWRRSTQPSTG